MSIFTIIVLTLLFKAKSIKYFDKKKKIRMILLTLFNYSLSISTIYGIIYYLVNYPKE